MLNNNTFFRRNKKTFCVAFIFVVLCISLNFIPFGGTAFIRHPILYAKILSCIDLSRYRVRVFSVSDTDEDIQVTYNYLPWSYDYDHMKNLDTAFKLWDMCKCDYPELIVSISTGGVGSSLPEVHLDEYGVLFLNYEYPKSNYLLNVMKEHNVYGLKMGNRFAEKYFDGVFDNSLEYLSIGACYDTSLDSLTNLQGLKSLQIVFYDYTTDCMADITLIYKMKNLDTLNIYGDLSMIKLPSTPCEKITSVEIHDESDLDQNEQLEELQAIFPNAKIVLEKE